MALKLNNDLFFLVGTIETAEKAIQGLRNILKLKSECETRRLPRLGKKLESAQVLLRHLFTEPLIRPNEVAAITGLSMVSSYKLIEDFVKLQILQEVTGNQRNRIFAFTEYFRVFN